MQKGENPFCCPCAHALCGRKRKRGNHLLLPDIEDYAKQPQPLRVLTEMLTHKGSYQEIAICDNAHPVDH